MSTWKHCWSHRHSSLRSSCGVGRPAARSYRPGFTLIELLVVVSIIALLISILLPSLKTAREQARSVVCGSLQRGLTTSFATYSSEYNEWIPGMNTSGVAMRQLEGGAGGDVNLIRDGSLPVQPQDWITPLISGGMSLPANRAERFKIAINNFKCPSQGPIRSIVFPDTLSDSPDAADFDLPGLAPWTALSYLMPVHFQFWGRGDNVTLAPNFNGIVTPTNPGIRATFAPDTWEYRLVSYRSRLDKVGPPASKIFAADGTRFLDENGLLDHDVAPFSTQFGSFATSGGWWSGSTAYGVVSGSQNWGGQSMGRGSRSDGRNLNLTYRHKNRRVARGTVRTNKGAIQAAYFDGHVELLTDKASRKVDLWYPKGAVMLNQNEGLSTLVREQYVVR
jgi:prepilin-type N-terminal cleavage/methylation domain-containing protein/prepilin-type processing-associated H-X9-DG protein